MKKNFPNDLPFLDWCLETDTASAKTKHHLKGFIGNKPSIKKPSIKIVRRAKQGYKRLLSK